MITEQDLHEYNKWLMEVWNPNQLHIPFSVDAPRAFLKHRSKVKNNHSNTKVGDNFPIKSNCHDCGNEVDNIIHFCPKR
jgi:hypothetical protein